MRLKRPEGLNVIPLIDVMLVLLAIVLTVSTFIAQGKIKIDLPEASTAEQKRTDHKLEIIVDSENRLFIDDVEVVLDALRLRVEQLEKDSLVVYSADKESKFGMFIDVVDILKAKGHENFQITAKQK
ncbi:MAG: TonB system transport protein ExbD [Wolinella sp.]